ncbi:MAG: metallophosphoesterase [Acidobacteria bacterium]|nr:MAG: metallophosphoesterase [Acidobacteriota bacterium]REK12128.1 MAG: metallophosphoesterase [Acidobacteriota bacterium]
MHGNWEALQAVLRRVRRKQFGETLVLGDLVGYGAAPNQVIEAMSRLPGRLRIVRGNHDKVAAGLEPGHGFNEVALRAAQWTTERLTRANLEYLKDLPVGPTLVIESQAGAGEAPYGRSVAICHGSPADEDCYVFAESEALAAFRAEPRAWVTFFGHTHLPSLFLLEEGRIAGALLRGSGVLQLDPDRRYLINPGSIGQPRDRDPRAAYMIYDSTRQTLRWYRCRYPLQRAQRRIVGQDLPASLAERLAHGI